MNNDSTAKKDKTPADDEKTLKARRKTIDEKAASLPKEHGGRAKEKGLEPTRYDDWELKGRCVDF